MSNKLQTIVRLTTALLSLACLLALICEVGVRVIGLTDFPLYEADNKQGYIPKADQRGAFMNKNEWQFNHEHMGSGPFLPSTATDTLLVGDSIVLGGNPYSTNERLGPRLQAHVGGHVWPISAGSWGLLNELAYLQNHPGVVEQIDQLVFVLNSGDFGEASSWRCEYTHPRSYPLLATYYLVKRYGFPTEDCGVVTPQLKVPSGNAIAQLQTFLLGFHKPVTVFLYPDKAEFLSPQRRHLALDRYIEPLHQAGVQHVISIADDKRWDASAYKDVIHPTVQATQTLAAIMADGMSAKAH